MYKRNVILNVFYIDRNAQDDINYSNKILITAGTVS